MIARSQVYWSRKRRSQKSLDIKCLMPMIQKVKPLYMTTPTSKLPNACKEDQEDIPDESGFLSRL